HDRAGHEDRAVGANHNADGQRQREAEEDLAAEEQQRHDDEKYRHRRDNRPRQHFVDADVEGGDEVTLLAEQFQVFADPVEDDDRVGERIPGQGEQGGNHQEVDFD